jgi:hypothetical protein
VQVHMPSGKSPHFGLYWSLEGANMGRCAA